MAEHRAPLLITASTRAVLGEGPVWDEASFITGQVFVIDGGQLAGQKASADLLRRPYLAGTRKPR